MTSQPGESYPDIFESKKRSNPCKKLVEYDLYPRRIELTYKGKSKYKTIPGSICSFIVTFVVVIYALTTLVVLLTRNNALLSKMSSKRDLNVAGELDIFDLGFDIAFGIEDGIDWTLLQFEVYSEQFKSVQTFEEGSEEATTTRQFTSEKIPMVKCDVNNFNYTNKTVLNLLGISQYFCLKNRTAKLEGTFINPNFQYISISVSQCKNTSFAQACKPQEAIDEFFSKGVFVKFFIVNYFFDSEDYEQPIKSFLDDTIVYRTILHTNKEMNVFLKKNEARLLDKSFMAEKEQKLEFISVDNVLDYDSGTSGNKFQMYLRYDSSFDIYKREVYDFFDWIGDIGGVLYVLYIVGYGLVAIYTYEFLNASMIKNLFQLQQNSVNPDREAETLNKVTKKGFSLNEEDVETLTQTVLTRNIFKYKTRDLWESFYKCMLCRNMKKLNDQDFYKHHHQFRRAKKKLTKEMDVLKIIRSVQYMKVLKRAIFEDHHRLLFEFQKNKVIHSDTSSSSENEGEVIKLTNNENPLIKQESYEFIHKLISNMSNTPLKAIDRSIIKGVIQSSKSSNQAVIFSPNRFKRQSTLKFQRLMTLQKQKMSSLQSQRIKEEGEQEENEEKKNEPGEVKMTDFKDEVAKLNEQKEREKSQSKKNEKPIKKHNTVATPGSKVSSNQFKERSRGKTKFYF